MKTLIANLAHLFTHDLAEVRAENAALKAKVAALEVKVEALWSGLAVHASRILHK